MIAFPRKPLFVFQTYRRSIRLAVAASIAVAFVGGHCDRQSAQGAPADPPAKVKNEKGPAYTTPPKDDLDFNLMGEFVGRIRKEGQKKKETLALQLRSLGNKQFQAMAYEGGLPGQDGYTESEMRLIGMRFEDGLVLSGGPWAIFVDAEGCTIVAKEGRKLGRLTRVHRVSPTLGAAPPESATVLFDGPAGERKTDLLTGAEVTEAGLLEEGFQILPMFQDFNLHAEFRLPYMPQADGQQRSNSGLYLQSRYECQILDSFGTERMFNGLGSLYRLQSPTINMALPPLVWQTYDIHFTAPRWASDGSKIRNAHITSWVNGVKVQDNVSLPNKTGAGKPEAPQLSPINVQDHGDPVRFRNLWIVDRGLTHVEFPVIASKEQREFAAKLEWNEPPKVAEPEEVKKEDGEKEDGEKEVNESSDVKEEDSQQEAPKSDAKPDTDDKKEEAKEPDA